MNESRWVRQADRVEAAGLPAGRRPALELAELAGTWVNTNPDSRGITRVVLRPFHPHDAPDPESVALGVRPFGAIDWGESVAGSLYADGLQSRRGMAFLARFDFGFLVSELQGNMNLGLLILASFNTWKDGSGRSPYFSREFYRLAAGGSR
jgi:hypothetical protein